MPITRKFLDWQHPGLPAAASWLLNGRGPQPSADLQNVIVVVPGGRAGRRLLELLVAGAESAGQWLTPPRIVTASGLPELLYHPKKPFADALTRQLAWVEAIQSLEPVLLQRIVRRPPPHDDLFAWLALAELIDDLHTELAADKHTFETVVEQGPLLGSRAEAERWQALATAQDRYLRRLDGLNLWDRQTARLFALDHHEFATDCDIVLVGAVDMNRAQRAMLDEIADRVTALIVAPAELQDRFDSHGCLIAEAWQNACIDVSAEQIELVAGPGDQADAVLRALANLNGQYCIDEIVVGIPDARIAPFIEQRLTEAELPARNIAGKPLAWTSPLVLLEAVADFLSGRGFAAFAFLVRHPDLGDWLGRQGIVGDWLTELDACQTQRLPDRCDASHFTRGRVLSAVYGRVETLLEPLTRGERPLCEWGEPILGVVREVFGGREWSLDDPADRAIVSACDHIRHAISEMTAPQHDLTPRLGGSDALRLLLRELSGIALPSRTEGPAIELLGWLELPLDDAPALVVTGMNEGIVPGSRNADLFLPNDLRRQLEIEDNDRRYARDAYALSVLTASRRALRLIAGRRSPESDPLIPSRLLFACEPEEIARRARTWFSAGAAGSASVPLPGSLRAGKLMPNFYPPSPTSVSVPSSMKVTEFADYLKCPYRYYLRHRVKLSTASDHDEELSPAAFGSLMHAALQAFAEGPACHSTNAGDIEGFLSGTLDRLAGRFYGKHPLPAVAVQVEQLRLRLNAFARWQADWARAGWEIVHAEEEIEGRHAWLMVDGKPMYLRGRIDRIDRLRGSGDVVILDYKTGDGGTPPEKTHQRSGEWIDLQLPLYRHLAPGIPRLHHAAGVAPAARAIDWERIEPRLGYIVIPKNEKQVAAKIAEWSPADLAAADQSAADVVRQVRLGKYWPPADPPPAGFDEFATICQDGILTSRPVVDEEDN